MGQKLEKLSEKDEESHDNSECSVQTGETEQSEAGQRDESRDQEDGGSATPQSTGGINGISVTGHTGEHTVTSARTDSQTGQPIRPLCRREHPFNTRGKWVGGDGESWSDTRTVEESETVPSPKETRQTSNQKQGSESKAVALTWTTAMEEQGNGRKSETGCSKSGPDTQARGLTATCDPTNEEDLVLENCTSFDGENDNLGNRKTENLQAAIKRRAEKDTSATSGDDKPPQPSRNTPQEKWHEHKSRRTSDTILVTTDGVEARARSSPAACEESEMRQRLAEVTGSRCQLKGAGNVGAAHTETTGRGKAEREQNMNDQSKGQVSTHRSTQSNSSRNLEKMTDKAGCLIKQEEVGGENKEGHNSEFIAEKTQVGQSYQNRFLDAVAKRAKAAVSSFTKKEGGQASGRAADKPLKSEIPQQDHSSFSKEQSDLIPPVPLLGNESCDGKIQTANSKRERDHVCFSAIVTPPPLTNLLSKKDTMMVTQLDTSMLNSQTVPEATPTKDESMPKEKLKVRGPPPPVPKKPKNALIKLKTAQLMSTDVQRRVKDHQPTEERVKRRHTFHFNKDFPSSNQPTNQDMCLLWDERGAYILPTNIRRLSVDVGPYGQHLSIGHVDDKYRDMIDYDYCVRMANLCPDEELQNLDMSQRRMSLERRSRYKSSPPPVAKKAQNPFASTQTLHIPEVVSDIGVQRPRPACSGKRQIYPEPLSERVNTQVTNDNHANYGSSEDVTGHRDAGHGSEVGSFKPVAELIKETNQMQRHQGRVKPEGAKVEVRVAEQGPSVKVSVMKNAFDVPKRSKERPSEVQPPPKKGKHLGLSELEHVNSVVFFHESVVYQSIYKVLSRHEQKVSGCGSPELAFHV